MKSLLSAALVATFTACGVNSTSFTSMNEAEIAAYNRSKPIEDQIYCVTGATSSSFIRRRTCRTYEEWITHNERSAAQLDVLNSSSGSRRQSSNSDWPG